MKNKHGIPAHIVKHYGSARAFKKEKRQILKRMEKLSYELNRGAAYFPNDGYEVLWSIMMDIQRLKVQLSVKNWGR